MWQMSKPSTHHDLCIVRTVTVKPTSRTATLFGNNCNKLYQDCSIGIHIVTNIIRNSIREHAHIYTNLVLTSFGTHLNNFDTS